MAGHLSLRKAMSTAKHGADGEKHCPSMRLSELTSIQWGSGQLTSIGDLDLRAILKNVDLDPRAILKKILRGIDSPKTEVKFCLYSRAKRANLGFEIIDRISLLTSCRGLCGPCAMGSEMR